jgi:hypothetical protein
MTLSIFKRRPGARRFHSRATRSHTRPVLFALGLLLALAFAGNALGATHVPLGNAASFGALSSTAMTNAGGLTVVNGDIGSSTSIDAGVTHPGFGAYGAGSSKLADGQASLLIAYGAAAAATPDHPTITGSNLAGQTLLPGVYNSTSSILISGPTALTLDGNGDPGSVFIFQAGTSLTVDPTSSVTLTNGAQACNVFWQVGSSAFLKNSGFTFTGTILALTQITLTDGITVNGRVLARNADVTFIHDTVNTPSCAGGGGSGAGPGAAPAAAPAPSRQIYCDANGKAYDLVVGQDKQPPYDTLGLVPAYVDPVTGSKSCNFPKAAPTPTPTPAVQVTPTPVTPTPVTPTPVTPQQTLKPPTTPKRKPVAAPKKKHVVYARPHPRPARHHVGLTG